MPLTRLLLRRGTTPAYRRAILDGIQRALQETFNVPDDDRFQVVTEHDADDFVFGADYLQVHRTDRLVIIQLTVSDTRTLEQKQALFRRIVEHLAREPGLRPEDVLINLVEVRKENWSLGLGLAQYA